MSSRDKARAPLLAGAGAASSSRKAALAITTATKKTMSLSSVSSLQSNSQPMSQSSLSTSTCSSAEKRKEKLHSSATNSAAPGKTNTTIATTKTLRGRTVIETPRNEEKARNRKTASSSLLRKKLESRKGTKDINEESSSSSQEMTVTSPQSDHSSSSHQSRENELSPALEQETNIDRSLDNQATDDDESTTLLELCQSPQVSARKPALSSRISGDDLSISQIHGPSQLPSGWEQHTDKEGVYYWHNPTGVIQRQRPITDALLEQINKNEPIVLCHDDEEINQSSATRPSRTSSEEDDCTLESGAALTLADESTLVDSIAFVVYPLGCCEFDETQLISASSTKAIQKCILRLSNMPQKEECVCWGLDQTQPILMRLLDDYIQFTDIETQTLLRSQPIQTIKTWAVDDDNNFAFVVEDQPKIGQASEFQPDPVDYALLTGPTFMCYVFSSMDDDDMSLKVATKLNKEINRYRVQMSNRISKSTRLQQMVDSRPLRSTTAATAATAAKLSLMDNDQTDADEDLDDDPIGGQDNDDDDLAESSEMSLNVRYIGKVQVPRPMGIDVLNVAIDKCLADASKAQMNRLLDRSASTSTSQSRANSDGRIEILSPLVEAKIHVSPSSVIVENEQTGEIIVECRIRYLTFMGISRRDIRWCGFIMQNITNQTFVAHCFECHPTAGHVCEAIQASCSRMYEKMVKRQKMRHQVDDATSIMPKTSKIRDTLARTLSKIKLTPII